jgi:protein TonB
VASKPKSTGRPSPPKAISRPRPPYPITAKRRKIEGYVKVRLLVDATGKVSKVTVVASSPPGVFDKVVRRTVSGWRFKPGTKNGKAVSNWVNQTIQFQLR